MSNIKKIKRCPKCQNKWQSKICNPSAPEISMIYYCSDCQYEMITTIYSNFIDNVFNYYINENTSITWTNDQCFILTKNEEDVKIKTIPYSPPGLDLDNYLKFM